MTSFFPLIPAEAGTQRFGDQRRLSGFTDKAAVSQTPQTWVPASAGMSGQDQ